MTNQTQQKPAGEIRDGLIKATIWRNPSKDGQTARYSTRFIRSYVVEQDGKEDQWNDTEYFSGAQLLRLSRLAAKAYDLERELRAGEV